MVKEAERASPILSAETQPAQQQQQQAANTGMDYGSNQEGDTAAGQRRVSP